MEICESCLRVGGHWFLTKPLRIGPLTSRGKPLGYTKDKDEDEEEGDRPSNWDNQSVRREVSNEGSKVAVIL